MTDLSPRPNVNIHDLANDRIALRRFVVVGLLQNGTFFALSLLLIWAGLAAWQATMILYPIAVLCSFMLNRAWSFAGRDRAAGQLRKHVLIYVAAYPATVFLNWIQEINGVPPSLATLFTMAIAVTAIFVALNSWVFRKSAPADR